MNETLANKSMSISTPSHSFAMDFDKLPKGFRPAKPFKELPPRHINDPIIQRKRDGVRVFLVVGNHAHVYSRRMEDLTQHFRPDTTTQLWSNFAPGTVLDAEYVVEVDGKDDFGKASAVCRSLPARGRQLHTQYQGTFHIFDILYLAGAAAYSLSYRTRFEALGHIEHALTNKTNFKFVQQIHGSLEEAQAQAVRHGWEGLVVWDGKAGTTLRLNGTDSRANCYKWKPVTEDDFVAIDFEYGTGSLKRAAGALHLAQYRNGQLINCGKVGTGLDLTTRQAAVEWKYPLVVEVRFSERTADGKLRFPVFVRTRPDKTPQECIS